MIKFIKLHHIRISTIKTVSKKLKGYKKDFNSGTVTVIEGTYFADKEGIIFADIEGNYIAGKDSLTKLNKYSK